MKHILSILVICLTTNFINSQLDGSGSSIGITGSNIHLPSDYLRNDLLGNNDVPLNTKGSQYVREEFLPSKVTINDSITYNAMLRYNAYADEIEMKKDGKITALFKRPYITATIANYNYEILEYLSETNETKTGYFLALPTQGPNKLYRKDIKIFKPGKEASSTYSKASPPSFDNNVNYYVLLENKTHLTLLKLKKKNIIATLGKSSELNAFLKKNKINLKNENDLLKLFNYYNNL